MQLIFSSCVWKFSAAHPRSRGKWPYLLWGLSTTLQWSELQLADSLLSSNDLHSHTNCRKKLKLAKSSNSRVNSQRSGANLKQKITCDFRIGNEMEMGLNQIKPWYPCSR